MNDLISVVVPVYNAKKYIKKCIKSLVNQTYKNLEIIFVNDGSTDGSAKILDGYARKNQRIIVVHQQNQGSVIARKNGVKTISNESKYTCFCDADDTLPLNSIEILYKNIVNDESDIFVGNSIKVFRNIKLKTRFQPGVFQKLHSVYNHNEFIENLYCSWYGISNVPVGLCAKMFKTDLLKSTYFDTPNVVSFFGDDLIQTINLFPKAKSITFINNIVYKYRIGGGTSKFQPKMMDDWIALYNYKKNLSKKYTMSQDIDYLMNVELCNMVFTYFDMLVNSHRLNENEICELINYTLKREEIVLAANDSNLINENHFKARAIRNKETRAIYNYLVENYKKKYLKNLLKKIVLFFN